MRRALTAVCVSLCLAGLWPGAAAAVDLRDVLTDYTITSWGRKDGVVGPVWALAQDAEGFLWLGTDSGVQRFDGVRFVSWPNLGGEPLPDLTVRALRVASDNSIWVGFGAGGGIARISGRSVRLFSDADGAFTGAVTTIVEDEDRAIWVAGTGGLYRFGDGQWQRFGAAQGLPDVGATTVYIDGSRRLWVSTSAGLFVRRDTGVDRFEQADDPADPIRPLSISQDRAGRIWTTDIIVGFRAVDLRATPRRDQYGRGYRILHDRQGNRWVGTIGQGLWRLRSGGPGEAEIFERATVLSGLSSDAVRSIIEDRDGNIWVGTTEGIDRLVPHRVTPWTGLGLVSSLSASPGPALWVGTEDELIRFSLDRGQWRPDPEHIAVPGMQSVRGGMAGRTWVSTADGLRRLEQRRLVDVPFPAGVRPAPIEALAADPRGGVWVIAGDGVVLRSEGDELSLFARVDALRDASVISAIADAKRRLWLLMTGSRVGVLSENGQFRVFGPNDGLTPVVHSTLHEGRDGSIWIAGGSDVMRLEQDRFVSVGRGNGLPSGILALTEDDQRNLWLATAAGIVRLPIDEFTAGAANPSYRMRMRIFDTSDGLAGYPVVGDRQAVRASDGTLWFVTSRGLSMLNPKSLTAVRPTSRVTLDEILADDRPVSATRLRAGTSKVQFAYTAPELTYPFKARFRYRLDGFDADWIDAENRRQAVYTNLPPRTYTFRVAVSTDESGWSELATPWTFTLAPRFYQTWWFYPAVALSTAGLIGAAWQLRLRQLRRQFSLVLAERVRLSRELHDTLLQSLVGVALEFDAVSKSIETSPAAAKARVVKIREHVEEYIREARRSIWSLRSPALETGDLLVALRESAQRATSDHAVALDFSVQGTPRRLPSTVEHQLLRIGQEAVLNAVRHAAPQHVSMTVAYSDDTIALRVADDGRGFNTADGHEGTTDHYGITTMRERAQQAGGRIHVTSEPGRGTLVEAVVPILHHPVEAQ